MKKRPQATKKTPRYAGVEIFEGITPMTNHERLMRYYQKRHYMEIVKRHG